jgi:hypothetical protein
LALFVKIFLGDNWAVPQRKDSRRECSSYSRIAGGRKNDRTLGRWDSPEVRTPGRRGSECGDDEHSWVLQSKLSVYSKISLEIKFLFRSLNMSWHAKINLHYWISFSWERGFLQYKELALCAWNQFGQVSCVELKSKINLFLALSIWFNDQCLTLSRPKEMLFWFPQLWPTEPRLLGISTASLR